MFIITQDRKTKHPIDINQKRRRKLKWKRYRGVEIY